MSLDAIEKRLQRNLKKQVQENLAQVFEETSCKAVGREIRAGRNVTGNAEWGIRFCVHPKTAARVDPTTLKFTPQSKRGKEIVKRFIELTNDMLETGGFQKMDPALFSRLQKTDKEFERDIAKRRKERKR